MKTAIYYFSGTGNTLVIARDIAQELGGADLIPITKALKSGANAPYEVIGIVFPVYMFGLPLIVADFVEKLNAPKDSYIFAVANFGGLPGRSLDMVKEKLRRRGLAVPACFGVMMPGNYTPLYGAIEEEKQRRMFEIEKDRVKHISEAVRKRQEVPIDRKNFLVNFLIYILLYRLGASQVPRSDKKFWATDKCTKCGLCEKVCPVSNIAMKDGRPTWLHHCENCMACLQWCPVEAIQYGRITLGRKRYHHPGVKAVDIMTQK